jgi:hypothetical protein
MNKFEFGDLNRFLVSLGLALMAAGPALLWLFYREPLDLMHPIDELAKLTPTAQQIVTERQDHLLVLLQLVPWMSAISISSGFLILSLGIFRWLPLQKLHEQMHTLQTRELEIKVSQMTPEEILTKAAAEVALAAPAAIHSLESTAPTEDPVRAYLTKEQLFLDAVADAVGDKYDVQAHQRIGINKYDAILRHRSKKGPDYIIEFKDFSLNYRPLGLKQALSQIAASAGFAQFLDVPRQIPMLVAVVPSNTPQPLADAMSLVAETANNPTPFGHATIRLIASEYLGRLRAADIRQMLEDTPRAMWFDEQVPDAG